jgi:hypothetical protein
VTIASALLRLDGAAGSMPIGREMPAELDQEHVPRGRRRPRRPQAESARCCDRAPGRRPRERS